jgi:DNA repair protein RadC
MCGWYLRMRSKWVTGLILCHNHPSGPVPSEADKQITKKLRIAGDSDKMLDHLIVTEVNTYSFVDEGIF